MPSKISQTSLKYIEGHYSLLFHHDLSYRSSIFLFSTIIVSTPQSECLMGYSFPTPIEKERDLEIALEKAKFPS